MTATVSQPEIMTNLPWQVHKRGLSDDVPASGCSVYRFKRLDRTDDLRLGRLSEVRVRSRLVSVLPVPDITHLMWSGYICAQPAEPTPAQNIHYRASVTVSPRVDQESISADLARCPPTSRSR